MINLKPRLLTALWLGALPALMANPILDQTFDAQLNSGANVNELLVTPDGRITVAGQFNEIDENPRNNLARLHSNGSLDTAFDPAAGPDGPIVTLFRDSQGALFVGGRFSAFNGMDAPSIAKLQPDGTLNNAFQVPLGISGSVQSIASVNGDLLVAGRFTQLAGSPSTYLGRLGPDGTPAAFSSGLSKSMAIEAGIDCMAVDTNGRILVAGNFATPQGPAQLVRLNADGSIDASFNGDPGPILYPTRLIVNDDGTILLAGLATPDNTGFVRRLLPNGAIDPAFNAPAFDGIVHDLCIQPNGAILAAARVKGASDPDVRAVRLQPDGQLDSRWSVQANGPILALALAGEGQILAGGAFSEIAGAPRTGLALLQDQSQPVFHQASAATGEFRAFLQALPGRTYVVESSADLSNWSTFSTNTATNAGLEIADKATSVHQHRFFRARLLP